MLVSIFGKLEYGKPHSVTDWAEAHAVGHRSLTVATGVPLQPGVLLPHDINDDWFLRHGMLHIALSRFYKPGQSTCAGLMVNGLSTWLNEGSFYDWHKMHDEIHRQANEGLGVKV